MLADYLGKPIEIGDTIAVASRRHSSSYLYTAKALEYVTTTRQVWSTNGTVDQEYEQLKVKSENGRTVIMSSYDTRRAVVVEKHELSS